MKNKKTNKINILFAIFLLICYVVNSSAQGSCASPDGSFFDPNGIYPVTYTMAQDSNWCHSIPIPSSTPTTVCYQFKYPASGNIQMSFLVTTSGCSSGDCGQNYYINQSNPSNCGSSTFCSGTAVSNFRIYNPDCSLFGTNTKIGCGMMRDSIYTLCIDINPTGCTSINICPIVNCPTANCIPTPPCTFTANISGSDSICSGNTALLTAGGGNTYLWSTGETTASITVSPLLSTTYTVTASAAGCTATATHTVMVNQMPGFTSDITLGCEPLCVTFNEISGNNCDSVFYNFGDNATSMLSAPTHCYTSAGSYSVSISCKDMNGCIGTTIVPNMITVFAAPIADFTISPDDVVEPGTTVTFTDISTSGSSLWNFGDPLSGINDTSSLTSPIHVYNTEGDYCTTLISVNVNGCADTVAKCIIVINDPLIIIPNVFTPNNDDTNDWFYFETKGIKELTCTIYDRWGLKMLEWNGVSEGWDGRTTSGNIAPDGVYYYVMRAVPANEKAEIIEKQGFLHLLKQ